jgi:hypothetical protein
MRKKREKGLFEFSRMWSIKSVWNNNFANYTSSSLSAKWVFLRIFHTISVRSEVVNIVCSLPSDKNLKFQNTINLLIFKFSTSVSYNSLISSRNVALRHLGVVMSTLGVMKRGAGTYFFMVDERCFNLLGS